MKQKSKRGRFALYLFVSNMQMKLLLYRRKVKWGSCSIFADIWKRFACFEVPGSRSSLIFVRETFRRKWIWSISGMILTG